MDVEVLHKRAQRSPQPGLVARLLGSGMLERARATSLALLGATAAVGLAFVAVALNQSWPLLQGSSIPVAPRQHVGSAAVVARSAGSPAHAGAVRRHGGGRAARSPSVSPAGPTVTVETPPGGGDEALVVSTGKPATVPGGPPKAAHPHGEKPPVAAQPTRPLPASTTPSGPSPPADKPAPAPTAPPTPPEAVVSEAPPEESSVPSWSHGRGHAYGREASRHDDGGDDDRGWRHDDDGGGWHGH